MVKEGRWDKSEIDYSKQAEIAAEAKRRGISEATLEMSRAVPTDLVRDLVSDFRRGVSQPSSIASPPKVEIETRRATSTSEPVSLMVPGLRWIDQQCDVADAIARRRRARELAGLPDDAA